jgi:hypothetical protein
MSNVIDFLERMGQDADLRHASRTEADSAMVAAHLDTAARAAIVAGDQPQLEQLLGATANTCCAIFPLEGPTKLDEASQRLAN